MESWVTNQEKTGRGEAVLDQQYSDEPLLVGFSRVKRGPQNPAGGQIVSTGNVFNVKAGWFLHIISNVQGEPNVSVGYIYPQNQRW